ncbi:hypothetical protein CANCADRAFT_92633 [Tortispora caseinolytica NRRL Y-17796]|uniref:Uncharacterized protein n=1 Tax=Tortispora caseinolytica NRRL Y-17796 TaxID=767744 RepID=A0A1E4TLV6_9ASCO|nr:hypothetical protein CANCADRAFT_92633 [Tortispora caseinolytica NRRL Y-17796]
MYEEDLFNINALDEYKYNSVDKSWTSKYILSHYWNAVVRLLPLSMAPNLVTLVGFTAVLFNIVLIMLADQELTKPPDPFICYSCALGTWVYSTMDNIDGKQARRTNSSSALGELFDHGIDALNCSLLGFCQAYCMGMASTKFGILIVTITCLGMYISTWETYYTNVLFLGFINAPTEGLIFVSLTMAACGYYGPEIWKMTLSQLITDDLPLFLKDVALNWAWISITIFGLIFFHIPQSTYNVWKVRKAANEPMMPALVNLMPAFTSALAVYVWVNSKDSLVVKNFFVFTVIITFICGRVCTRITVAHLLKQPFPRLTVHFPLLIGAILFYIGGQMPQLSHISRDIQPAYIHSLLLYSGYSYYHFSRTVIKMFCEKLGISPFSVQKKVDSAKKTN